MLKNGKFTENRIRTVIKKRPGISVRRIESNFNHPRCWTKGKIEIVSTFDKKALNANVIWYLSKTSSFNLTVKSLFFFNKAFDCRGNQININYFQVDFFNWNRD
jgi:hypothetical protein